MKKFLSILILIPSLVFAQNQSNGFVITGKITGIADGEVKIASTQEDHTVIAKDSIRDGSFTLKGSIPEPGLYFLVVSDQQPQYLYLENSPISITGDRDNIKNLQVQGSRSHTDFLEFN